MSTGREGTGRAPGSAIFVADLVGRQVETADGEKLGHVIDLEISREDDGYRVRALELGRYGWIDRLNLLRPMARRMRAAQRPKLVPWHSVERLEGGAVVLRAETRAR